MDFLKACSTNVQRLNIANISHAQYTYSVESDHKSLLTDLRKSNTLCCEHDARLYVFNAFPDHKLDLEALVLEEEGTLGEHPLTSGIFDRWKDAIEQGISYRLAGDKRVLKLGLWTWLYPSAEGDCVLTRLYTKLSEPGLLSCVTVAERTNLSVVTTQAQTGPVLLSPSGVAATLLERDHSLHEDDESARTWKAELTEALSRQGIVLEGPDDWARVELESHVDTPILWPVRLCLAVPVSSSQQTSDSVDDASDPLTFAQQWAEATEDRRRALAVSEPVQGVMQETSIDDDMSLVTSPPFPHRPGLSNMAGVYPTPPEGMTSNTATQANLLIETSMQTQQEQALDNNDLFRVQTHDGIPSLGMRQREPSIASSTGMDTHQTNTDDLFGEPDTELAGGEVDENDFDFFDDGADRALTAQTHEHIAITASSPPATSHTLDDTQTQLDDTADLVMADADTSPVPPLLSQTLDVHPDEDTDLLVDESSLHANNSASLPKPLSPFDIRERLLPPPVPASISNQGSQSQPVQRQNSFAPITFNPDLKLGARSQSYNNPTSSPTRRQSYVARTAPGTPGSVIHAYGSPAISPGSHSFSDSDDDTSESSIDRAGGMPPTLPWQMRKRKRITSMDDVEATSWAVQASPMRTAELDVSSLLEIVLKAETNLPIEAKISERAPTTHAPVDYGGTAKDLLMIAQLASEQAITCTRLLVEQLDVFDDGLMAKPASVEASRNKVITVVKDLVSGTKSLDPAAVASPREPSRTNAQLMKGQPRPPVRSDALGTEIYSLPAPYLRFQRADSNIEMWPPAVSFWDALSLSPVYTGKNIRPFFVLVDRPGLRNRLNGFYADLKASYESGKLGIVHDTGTPPQQVVADVTGSVADLYQAYHSACMGLVDRLVEEAFDMPDYSFVVMLVQPESVTTSMLCACFWSLYKSYRDRVVARGFTKKASDVCLQLVPTSLICSPDNLVLLSDSQTATLAREIYDRCPPGEDVTLPSPLAIATAPSLVLADALPKRINFQLSANAPTDLMHDGSELHVAYAKSLDGLWLTVVWVDNTGAGQQTSSFCLRGTTIAAILKEVWNRSLNIMRARPVSWRIGIATADALQESEVSCWRDILSAPMSRRVGIFASLVLVQATPSLSVQGPTQDGLTSSGPGGVITPVSTPQGSGLTASPDATGTGQTAPPTPAPTEPSVDMDPDAHLVDLPDETWAMLLDSKLGLAQQHTSTLHTVAQGALVKHGAEGDGTLPVIGVSIAFTFRIRGNSNAPEEANTKQAEGLLRELLSAYRGLGVLTKVRGLQDFDGHCLPLHITAAQKAVGVLVGLLKE